MSTRKKPLRKPKEPPHPAITLPRVLFDGTYRKRRVRVVHVRDENAIGPILMVEEQAQDATGSPSWREVASLDDEGEFRDDVVDFALVWLFDQRQADYDERAKRRG